MEKSFLKYIEGGQPYQKAKKRKSQKIKKL